MFIKHFKISCYLQAIIYFRSKLLIVGMSPLDQYHDNRWLYKKMMWQLTYSFWLQFIRLWSSTRNSWSPTSNLPSCVCVLSISASNILINAHPMNCPSFCYRPHKDTQVTVVTLYMSVQNTNWYSKYSPLTLPPPILIPSDCFTLDTVMHMILGESMISDLLMWSL